MTTQRRIDVRYDPAVRDDATAQAQRLDGPDRLDDPFECDICGESLPDGERRCLDCRAETRVHNDRSV